MLEVSMFKTFDGELHESTSDAIRHLDKIYGDKICRLGREAAHLSYTQITVFIDNHLKDFNELRKIKKDMELVVKD
jgi:hypothetical protein